jgi:hypothetical protein
MVAGEFRCWLARLSLPDRVHDNVLLCEYYHNGPRYMLQSQVASALGIPISSFRDILNRRADFQQGVTNEDRPAYLRLLKQLGGVVATHASHAGLVRVSVAAKAVANLVQKDVSDALRSFRACEPPLHRSMQLAREIDSDSGDGEGGSGVKALGRSPSYQQEDALLLEDEPSLKARPHINPEVEFPSSLPRRTLSPDQMKEGYGFTENCCPMHIQRDIQAFCEWAAADFNFLRTGLYVKPVQSTTLSAQVPLLRGYLGFVASFKEPNIQNVDLTAYANPGHIADFVAYLIARRVGKGHILQHMALAKKIVAYLQADPEHSSLRSFLLNMQDWLGIVEKQVSASLASRSTVKATPDADDLFAWARAKATAAWSAVEADRANLDGRITFATARGVHDALLVAFVTGAFIPPCRLNFLKQINRPDLGAAIGCDDPDCQIRDCKGNRFEIVCFQEGPDETPTYRVRSIVVHGKNDRRPRPCNVQYLLPEGDLTNLLLAHIDQGHETLTAPYGGCPRLFVSANAKPFSDSLFCNYWNTITNRCPFAPMNNVFQFPAAAARTAFVEDFTGARGVQPEFWDGAAVIMGSSTKQWTEAAYRPGKRSAEAHQTLRVYEGYVTKRIAVPSREGDMMEKDRG